MTRPGQAEIADQFVSLIGGERVERLIVMSPYWDDGLAALGDLAERLGSPSILVLVDPGAHGLPHPLPIIPNLTLVDCSAWRQGRFKHAKLIFAQTRDHDHVLSGSANCTQPALGVRGRPGVNAEASVYRRTARDVAVSALDLNGLVSGPTLAVATLPVAARPAPIPCRPCRISGLGVSRPSMASCAGVRHRVHGRALSHFSMAMVSRSGVLTSPL